MISENDAAAALGCSREYLRDLRKNALERDKHWTMKAREVVLTPEGVEAVREHIMLNCGSEKVAVDGVVTAKIAVGAALAGILERAGKGADEIEVTVKRMVTNPRIVLADTEDGEEVRVAVRSSKNFRPGMVVPVRAVDAASGMYELARACPRYPGRW
jgi:hypothetical protein